MRAVRYLMFRTPMPEQYSLTGTGLGVLFQKLQQGVQENQQILTIARLRADAEEAYGNSLANITPATDRISGGFGRDEGASVRKVRAISGKYHIEVANLG